MQFLSRIRNLIFNDTKILISINVAINICDKSHKIILCTILFFYKEKYTTILVELSVQNRLWFDMKVTGSRNLIRIIKGIKLREKKKFDLILRSTLSISSCATSRKRSEMPFNVLSADTARANNRGSILKMIQYHHSIFDIFVRGQPVSCLHLTELHPIRKFIRTLFPARFNCAYNGCKLESRIKAAFMDNYWIKVLISFFYVKYENWIFLTPQKSDVYTWNLYPKEDTVLN